MSAEGASADLARAAAGAVSEARLGERLAAMAEIGATGRGGVNRQALTPEEIKARQLFVRWGLELGLEPLIDDMGNLFLRRAGSGGDAAPVVAGSHLDSQPTGGRFDGTYGVLAALEAVQALDGLGIKTAAPVEVAAWTNEEGARFSPGCLGSKVFADPGRLPDLLAVKDLGGVSVADALAAARRAVPEARRRPLGVPVKAYIEAHIEQGPVLEAQGKTIGVVTGIAGRRHFRVEVKGEEAHAGTTPPSRRRDALAAALRMIAGLERVMADPSETVRFTVGRLVVSPNAPSVVPGAVLFTVDFRHPEESAWRRLGDQVPEICKANAGRCAVTVTEISTTRPIAFTGVVRDTIEAVTRRLELSWMPILSGAGHDAENLALLCPTGMLFVPCERGISHNESENAALADLTAGTRVLGAVIAEIAGA
jgi:beta-ureidopropionase / N-carbamoyl-L-amino-acid hydrolase